MAGSTLYGIANCDTVKRARAWLGERGIDFEFHDFKKAGVPAEELERWLGTVGWEKVLNRKGTTWRKLDESERAAVVDNASAKALVLANASVIKRPVVQWNDGTVTVGFNAEAWDSRF